MASMKVSTKGTAFIAAHEGFVSRAYRCPAGVVTIGYGFTMGSKVFADFWRKKHGRALQMGDTITRADADAALKALLDGEYGAAVNSRVGTKVQYQFDGASSVSFNCGPGALSWKWAQALKAGNVAEAARLLRTAAVTANGRKLAGLVRRRSEEARLIETGAYGAVKGNPAASKGKDEVREYQQQLVDLGHKIEVDGIAGAATKAAVKEFQRSAGLKVDGIVGPATRAALIRAIDAKRQNNAATNGGAAGGVGGGATETGFDPNALDWSTAGSVIFWGLIAAALIYGGFWLYRNRGRFTGQRVPT